MEQESRTLREIDFKHRYKSSCDDILNEFFIPAISVSNYYYRVAGFFSSSVLSATAKGLASFIDKGIMMQLVIGGVVNKDDVEAINKGYSTPVELLEKNLGSILANIEHSLVTKRLEVLAWLVSSGKLDIKVALPTDSKGQILPSDIAYWHAKYAIFQDADGNKIQIEGSINETELGWTSHSESFSVHKSWIDGQRAYVDDTISEFQLVWDGELRNTLVLDLPTATKESLLKYRTTDKPSIDFETTPESEELNTSVLDNLWPHQEKAVSAWVNNEYMGILAMATGSGKTRAALACINTLLSKNTVILILAPKNQIVLQWEDEIRNLYPTKNLLVCTGETNWKDDLSPLLFSRNNTTFILSTIQSAYKGALQININELVNEEDLILVIDEVHRIGAEQYSATLEWCNATLGRLGLSATPLRAWDTTGTTKILEYFKGVVYEYPIKDAIQDGYLCKYEYYPRFVSLEDHELEQYSALSKRIAQTVAKKQSQSGFDIQYDNDDEITILLNKRANIIKQAERKIPKAIEIIKEHQLSRGLIYCDSESQIDAIASNLDDSGISYTTFTSNVRKRNISLKKFEDGDVNLLLAIQCLDEGVDIPWIKEALIISSSTNSAQFIQRRGRILRQHPSKEIARIFDISVLPFEVDTGNYVGEGLSRTEKHIINKEMKRIHIFLEDAENAPLEYLNILDLLNRIDEIPETDRR